MLDLQKVLESHAAWLRGEGGERANLYGANLRGANLRGANLYGADLYGANLTEANLTRANLRDANLYGANLRGANLYGANLTRAKLYGANLYGADLWGAIGNGKEICSIQAPKYPVAFTAQVMQIGCQRWTLAEWESFDDSRIAAMDSGALAWWHVWKPVIFAMVAASGFKVESGE
jgi:hypothetical protein